MRFKEIKPGMAIRCDTREESNELLKELESLGYKWGNYRESPRVLMGRCGEIIFNIRKNYEFGIGFSILSTHTFKDLIIKDELTNEEVIELLKEKYTKSYTNVSSVGWYTYQALDDKVMKLKPSEIIDELVEYKKSKEIKVVSKEEYSKVASDKLDELYPKGWMVAEWFLEFMNVMMFM